MIQQPISYKHKTYKSMAQINRLKTNNDKPKVMLIWSKAQLESLNVDDFISS